MKLKPDSLGVWKSFTNSPDFPSFKRWYLCYEERLSSLEILFYISEGQMPEYDEETKRLIQGKRKF